MDTIPVVDLSPLVCTTETSLDLLTAIDCRSEESLRIAKEITKAFKHIGFVYLINHGINQELIDRVQRSVGDFFKLPTEVKTKYRRTENNHGWVGLQVESLDPSRPGDYKEAYNVTPCNTSVWPNSEVSGFEDNMKELYEKERQLSQLVLGLVGLGLGLKDPDYFAKCHNTKTQPSFTTLRCLHYPPLPTSLDLAPGTVRCGEHSDYGSITILWQDQCGGLEVKNRNGNFDAAVPVKGSLLVNVGDLMQRWTSDTLVSTKHRVLIPEEELKCQQSRRSIAFFMHPDDDVIIRCVEGSNKYPPITAVDYIKQRFSETY